MKIEENILVRISKDEKNYLVNHGVRFGTNGISHTCSCHSKRRTYYLCESSYNMKLLKKYREENYN